MHEANIPYLQAGAYQIPALSLPEQPILNRYAHLRWNHLRMTDPNRYAVLLMNGQLTEHLQTVGENTLQMVRSRMNERLLLNPAPEKSKDPLAWSQHMEQLRLEAEQEILPQTVYC